MSRLHPVGTTGRIVQAGFGPEIGDPAVIVAVDTEDITLPYRVRTDGGYDYWITDCAFQATGSMAAVPWGMTSEQLAEYFAEFIRRAQARVTGIGHSQYGSDSEQRFEAMTPAELIDWAREEAQDLAVYAAMIDIRLARIAEDLAKKGITDAA